MTYRRLNNSIRAGQVGICGVPIIFFTYGSKGGNGKVEAGDERRKIFGGGGICELGLRKRRKTMMTPDNLIRGDCVWTKEFVEPRANGSIALIEVKTSDECLGALRSQ